MLSRWTELSSSECYREWPAAQHDHRSGTKAGIEPTASPDPFVRWQRRQSSVAVASTLLRHLNRLVQPYKSNNLLKFLCRLGFRSVRLGSVM